ncbi:hypothetical protein PybrP1_008115 [[Pythium] brassicae (nom. inval.)]|nr:hypothetical protein PybrP1_008115 [[Pythium] brassicae (nom. inval.)]
MKFFVAAIAAVAALSTVTATSESTTIHVRVHVPSDAEKAVARWGQCKYTNEPNPRACEAGSVCRVRDQNSGMCYKEPAGEWEQCGGFNWTGSCTGGLKCVRRDGEYAQCLK